MADLPSILGGMAQGFIDFGKGAVDLFGTGGAAIGDLVDTIKTGKVSTKNQDDFRKWLYNTDSVEDAAAKGLGTALNGVQTVTDYIPGIGAVTKNPLFNAGQGALGGLADEFKTYGKDYDLGRAGERASVSAGAALASGGLGDALKKSASPLLSSGTVQGLARGATGGAITGGGYAAIDGGDIAQSALQGAGTGALIGGATGAIQDFMPRKATYDMALTDEEKAARIANAKNMLANEQNPQRIAELNNQIKDLGGAIADVDNRRAQFDLLQKTNPMRDDYHTGIRSPEDIYTLKSIVDSYNADDNFTYPDFTLADAQKALASGNIDVYSSKPIEAGAFISPSKMMATDYAGGGEVYTKNIPLRDFAFIESGDEGNYLPTAKALETTLADADMAVNAPSENMKLYRGISAPDDATLQRYIDEMKDPNIAPTTHSGGSAYGQGYYFTPDEGLARYYANESGLPSTAIMEIEVPRNRFTEISKENGNRPADFDLAAIKRGVPEDIRYETGLKDFNDYLDNNGYWGSKTSGENPTYTIMRNDAVLNAKRIDTPSLEATLADADMAVNNPRYLTDENGNPMTLYHGSPNKNITEFDINQAGKNTRSGERALYFTDSPEVADEFSYERLPSDSMFVDNRGAKGRVYPVNLEMNNPLDLDNLTDAQIRELWQYASPLGQLDGQEKFIKNLTEFRAAAHNGQLTKTLLDLDKLANSQYDGFTARMYPNQANQAREYAVFDNSKIKMLEDLQAVNDANIMASRMLPDDLDLGRTLAGQDMAVNSAKIAPGQLGLFDQPK